MGRIDWARAAQFNWAFDNLGGTRLQEAVAGSWQGAVAQVGADGCITLTAPNPGGGQVYFIRGVFLAGTGFPWSGFWADPMDGDLTNYYTGGSFVNQGETSLITLGTPLPPETPVQLYYIYLTGEQSTRYEPLNNYPCVRRALRSRGDFTYDFAVDRMLDLMACLHFAGPARGKDYTPLMQFLWEAFVRRQTSCTSPLMQDSFERQSWDRGAHLMYRGATTGTGAFQTFQSEPAAGGSGRVLHVRAALPGISDAAWFGYGLDWSLAAPPFSAMDRLSFKLQGPADTRRLHNLTKIGSGSATMILKGDYTRQEKCRFVVQILTTGPVGTATCRWSRDDGETWEGSGLVSGDRQHPLALWAGVEIYWEGGSGTHLVAGDYWIFWAGEPAVHPHKLLIILNDSTPDLQDPWGPAHTYSHAIPDRFAELTSFELPFSQFWRRDNLIEDGDRVTAMWGAWYSTSQPDSGDITIGTVEATEVLFDDTFYTQRLVTWNFSAAVSAFGAWAGIDSSRCNSTGHSQVNFLIKPVVLGAGSLTLRVKVKDAQGSYFHKDVTVSANAWQRVSVSLADLQLESGSAPLTHPLQVIDLGMPSSPPVNGAFYITDLKFGEHLSFDGAGRLRTLEFKLEQQGLEEHEWWLDDLSLNLEAPDPYPYAPRLAISLTPYGQNPWRGPTPVHYAQPLAPYLAGAVNLAQTYLALHRDAQEEFHQRYGGLKGPIMPVHTRNDLENIALLGCDQFNQFCWWPEYPEMSTGLAQYWAFMRLAQYYFVTGDAGAWAVLDTWLIWLDANAAVDGPGWKFPANFGPAGFSYGDYDPGQTAALTIGCLYCYLRAGDSRALTWTRRLLDDLRLNRLDPDYGGYRSDRHYAWLNALALQAFGLAVNGVPGQFYRFPAIPEDQAHFDSLISWVMAQAGDAKPNVLNADLIPFAYSEPGDLWDYAPNYLTAGEMGTLEAVVLMLGAALEYGKLRGDWDWFNRLLSFVLRDNLVALNPVQLRNVTAACEQTGAANLVRLYYADYDRDGSKYCEGRDEAAIDNWGEKALDLDFRYGSPVILEDPAAAQLLAARLLQRLAAPQESAEVETWLEGARLELGDTVAVSSDFHGWDREEFTVQGKNLDLGRHRVQLKLSRPLERSDSWAVDAAGSAFDGWAIDQASSWDESWDFRAFVY